MIGTRNVERGMSSPAPAAVAFVGPVTHWWAVVAVTARAYFKRANAYLIDVIRWPLFPLIFYATMRLTYAASGQETVAGANVSGFLLVGMFGLIIWSGTIWSSGYAIEYERYEGTIAALFLSPASRAAVVAGYGLGGFVWMLPAFVVVTVLGLAIGARFDVASLPAVIVAVLALLVASLAIGFALAGVFILSRRANLLANFIQLPMQLLSGLLFPRAALPDPLHALSHAIPVSHAIDALRASSLNAATLRDTLTPILLTFGISACYALVGLLSLRRVEHAAKRAGQLDLY